MVYELNFSGSKIIPTILEMSICNIPRQKKQKKTSQFERQKNFKANNFALDDPISINLISLCRSMTILSRNTIIILKIM